MPGDDRFQPRFHCSHVTHGKRENQCDKKKKRYDNIIMFQRASNRMNRTSMVLVVSFVLLPILNDGGG